MILTRAQRVALKRVYDRGDIDKIDYYNAACDHSGVESMTPEDSKQYCDDVGIDPYLQPLTYREFRRTVKPAMLQLRTFDTIMINWAGLWLGIEPDGYTHS